MTRSTEVEVKVGIFVAIGLGLVMFGIVMVGGGQSIFQRSYSYKARFNQIEGLVEGATVKIAGIKVGQVTNVELLHDKNQVIVTFSVASRYHKSIHDGSTVGIQTQGMLGDRYLIVYSGNSDSPVAKEGTELKAEAPKDLKDYLSDADEVLDKLKGSLGHIDTILGSFAREGRSETFFRNISGFSNNMNDGTKGLREASSHLNSILTKIDRGEGTIGSLVNDPALYDDIRALLGGANRSRVLKYFIKKSVEESREAASSSNKEQK